MTIGFQSATELAGQIRERKISSRELTEYFIERIDGHINAVVVKDFERALLAASDADAALARGDAHGPFHGLPMTIKEAYNVAGLPTTFGFPEFVSNIANEDAEVVVKLKKAGAVFLEKTNVPTGLIDGQSSNSVYGTTNNPWNIERVPGGSSGGAAAALAAGFTSIESGSDTAGSIRSPAHYCGVFGHKPTQGVVPVRGHSLREPSTLPDMGVTGPLARNANDLAMWMQVVAGADSLGRRGWILDLPKPQKKKLNEYRVAILLCDSNAPVSNEVSERLQAIADRLSSRGATVSDTARPEIDFGEAWRVFLSKLRSPAAGGVTNELFAEWRREAEELTPDDESELAIQIKARVQRHRDWLHDNQLREVFRVAWHEFYRDWDILICPSTMTPAFAHDHTPKDQRAITVDGERYPFIKTVFWPGIVTVASLPSTDFPTGVLSEGLPIGLQAVGAEFDDYICIEFAGMMADEFGGFVPPPGFDD